MSTFSSGGISPPNNELAHSLHEVESGHRCRFGLSGQHQNVRQLAKNLDLASDALNLRQCKTALLQNLGKVFGQKPEPGQAIVDLMTHAGSDSSAESQP